MVIRRVIIVAVRVIEGSIALLGRRASPRSARYDWLMAGRLHIDTFSLGPWQTNCFIVHTDQSTDCWIVDAGFDPQPLIAAIDQRGLVPSKLLLTHGHLDHIAGISLLRDRWPSLPILIHADDREFLTNPDHNLSGPFGMPITTPPATGELAHGDQLVLEDFAFELRHTPGHSPGGISLYCPMVNQAIVGDTLFAGSIGRFDFPHSHGPTLFASIRDQLLTLPDTTIIHPGHGPSSTIARERSTNPYLN